MAPDTPEKEPEMQDTPPCQPPVNAGTFWCRLFILFDEVFELVKDYLNALKKEGNYSWADIENMSGIPEATARKIFSGETADPRLETVVKLVIAMGGNMDGCRIGFDAGGSDRKVSATITLKESCEMRVEDQKEYIASLKRDKNILGIACAVMVGALILLLILDIIIASSGQIQL